MSWDRDIGRRIMHCRNDVNASMRVDATTQLCYKQIAERNAKASYAGACATIWLVSAAILV